MAMKTWECPKCHTRVTCLGVVEGHKCSGLSAWVPGRQWILIPPPEKKS